MSTPIENTTTKSSRPGKVKLSPGFFDEAIEMLQRYLMIDTSNPPAKMDGAVAFFSEICGREGIFCKVYESEPGKPNFLAKIEGTGKKRPILFLNHMDVVPVEREQWSMDPFGGEIKDGFLFGRGALDMKCVGIFEMMALIYLARNKITPNRTVFFLGTPDEETGGPMGAAWAVENIEELKNLEAVINEGMTAVEGEDGELDHLLIDIAEKIMFTVKLRTTGTPGHASLPTPDNANIQLVQALNRLIEWNREPIVTSTVKQYFHTLAPIIGGENADKYRDIENSLKDPAFREEFYRNPRHFALVNNTMSLTILKGGSKSNVIPNEAEAYIDFRLLPIMNKKTFLEKIKKVIDDEGVEISIHLQSETAPESSGESDVYKALMETLSGEFPGIPVAPAMMVAVTDSRFFRAHGINSYGFEPIRLSQAEFKTIHGNDECISLENIKRGVKLTVELVSRLI